MSARTIASVCVFAGSRPGTDAQFMRAAAALGHELHRRDIGLVYGGGTVGLMGAVAHAALDGRAPSENAGVGEAREGEEAADDSGAGAGADDDGDKVGKKGNVTGVIPRSLAPREISGDHIGEAIVCETMHERKHEMYNRADAFVALPGGFGTLEELLEVITWQQLGIHSKPIGVLNVNGYFDPLLQLVRQGVEAGFIGADFGSRVLVVESDPVKMVEAIVSHSAPVSEIKWMTDEQT